jgi:CRISPR-associated endoribonuclease Cas2
MRHCYLVCYDICDTKRLRRVHKMMKGFGESWQYSIFFCILKDTDRVRLQVSIEEEINQHEDRVMILELGSDEHAARKRITVLGEAIPEIETGMVVI